MANYAYVSVRKLSTTTALNNAYKHNYRLYTPANVNPELSHLNDEAVVLEADGFKDAFQKRLESLEYYKDHKFRKNGVRALELTLEYSPEAAGTFNLDEWKKANVEWLQEKFGKENVISVVYHYDEGTYEGAGVIHGHAVVIPVDDRGQICSNSFIQGKKSLMDLQTEYAKAMSPFGLKRGISGQHMKHEDIARMYARTADEFAKEPIPVQFQGESDKDYADRLVTRIEDMRAANVRQKYLHEKEIRELKAEGRVMTESQKDKRIAYLEGENERLSDVIKDMDGMVREHGGVQRVVEKADNLDMLNYAIENHPDESLAINASEVNSRLLDWARKEKKKQKETGEIEGGEK